MRTASTRRRTDAGTTAASSRLVVLVDGELRCTASEAFARDFYEAAVNVHGPERVDIAPEHTIDLTT